MRTLSPLLVAGGAAIMLLFGLLHLLYTFYGPKLLPRDRELQVRMQEVSPVMTRDTTMWKAWVGFNASHSFAINWPYSRSVVSFNGVLVVFVLAVLANICYCTAYLGDVFVQVSGFREPWLKWRWVLFVIGIVFAAISTRWFAIGFFTPPHVG